VVLQLCADEANPRAGILRRRHSLRSDDLHDVQQFAACGGPFFTAACSTGSSAESHYWAYASSGVAVHAALRLGRWLPRA